MGGLQGCVQRGGPEGGAGLRVLKKIHSKPLPSGLKGKIRFTDW